MLRKFATAPILQRFLVVPGRKTAHLARFSYEPRSGFIYVTNRAISSRVNDNHDEFSAAEIKAGYQSFIGKPCFVNHVNHDPRRARGVILDAVLHEDINPDGTPDTWVEVLKEVDALRFPKLTAGILSGEIDKTSMGVDVDYSICTACGNRAATIAEYCKHVPGLKGQKLTRRLADGSSQIVLIAEKCVGLRFFEDSFLVEEPADPTAAILSVDDRGMRAFTTASTAAISTTFNPIAYISHPKVIKVALDQTVVPPKVDTLHSETCPYCGADGFNGEVCAICRSVKPPDDFTDPDLEAAQQQDLRAERTEKPLVCDSCGQTSDGQAGDACPSCAKGTLGGQEVTSDESQAPGIEESSIDPDAEQDADPEALDPLEPDVPEDEDEYQKPELEPKQDDEGSDEDEQDDEDGQDRKKKKPPFLGVTMGPVLAALAAQQRRLDGLVEAFRLVLGDKALSANPRLAALLSTSDIDNPAQPIPEPAAEAPVVTTQEALTPDLTESVDSIGGTMPSPGPDAVDKVDSIGGTIPDPGADATTDVTAPVAGTQEVRPESETVTTPNITIGDPLKPEVANPLEGPFAQKATAAQTAAAHPGPARTWTALRLARLRIQAGISAHADDLLLGQALDADTSLSTEAMQAEVITLAQVVQRAQAASKPAARNLVPQRTAARQVPSLAVMGASEAATNGVGEDSALFE